MSKGTELKACLITDEEFFKDAWLKYQTAIGKYTEQEIKDRILQIDWGWAHTVATLQYSNDQNTIDLILDVIAAKNREISRVKKENKPLEDQLAAVKEELRIGNVLCAELTDKNNDLQSDIIAERQIFADVIYDYLAGVAPAIFHQLKEDPHWQQLLKGENAIQVAYRQRVYQERHHIAAETVEPSSQNKI